MQTMSHGYRCVRLIVRMNVDAILSIVATGGGLMLGAWLGMELLELTLPH
ncbi:MAG: hypothetical protein AAFR47_01180 [Pseudomonadota bacterium]